MTNIQRTRNHYPSPNADRLSSWAMALRPIRKEAGRAGRGLASVLLRRTRFVAQVVLLCMDMQRSHVPPLHEVKVLPQVSATALGMHGCCCDDQRSTSTIRCGLLIFMCHSSTLGVDANCQPSA